ncbi:hypothetical protein DYB30_006034 [Aphanomyces astaci]|uniref:Anaphase-promoting complex subunit 5 n=1 Tax=Aphanomyces astaci TaxID=112090 RepID=A0A397CG25_APHAT|nr:hypothetical protein DYB30_006034 [Aphanomyces astaci]
METTKFQYALSVLNTFGSTFWFYNVSYAFKHNSYCTIFDMAVAIGASSHRLLVGLTPHNVCVGFLIAMYIREYDACSMSMDVHANDGINPHHALAVFLMEHTCGSRSSGPLTFAAFCAALDTIHPTWSMEYQVVMRRLSTRSVHDLAECLVTLCLPGTDDVLVASTPFGRFARMLALAIHSAFFDGLCILRDHMQSFVAPSTPSVPTTAAPSSLLDTDHSSPIDDVHFRTALQTDPTSPRLLFARYVNFQRRREFLGALDALHAYHNIALHVATDVPDMKRFGPHYASLNLAIFYWTFGHPAKATAALHEAVRVAQSARDNVCVAYALSYLLQWDCAPFDLQRALHCMSMADAAGLPRLSLLAKLTCIQHGSSAPPFTPPSVQPLRSWLAVQACGTAANAAMTTPPPSSLASGEMEPKQAKLEAWVHTQVQIGLTQAAVWRRLGFRSMQRLALARVWVTLHADAPFNALPALMECLALCEDIGSEVLMAQAKVLLARLYVAMERAEDAVALLEEICPYVLEHGGWKLQAEVGLEMAKAYFVLQEYDKCLVVLEPSKVAAVNAEDLLLGVEVGMMIARVYHMRQDWEARDRVADECLRWNESMEASREREAADVVCVDCGEHTDPPYDVSKSTTANYLTCAEYGHCYSCESNNHCRMTQSYAEGSMWSALMVSELCWVGPLPSTNDDNAPDEPDPSMLLSKFGVRFPIGCQTKETGLFLTQKENGIMGMSQDPNTIVPFLVKSGVLRANLFSLCFADTGDSGSTDSYFPSSVGSSFASLYRTIANGHSYREDDAVLLSPSDQRKLPNIQIVLRGTTPGSSVVLSIPPLQYYTANADGSVANNIHFTQSSGGVLGASTMANFDVIFDMDQHRVGFAPARCDDAHGHGDFAPNVSKGQWTDKSFWEVYGTLVTAVLVCSSGGLAVLLLVRVLGRRQQHWTQVALEESDES